MNIKTIIEDNREDVFQYYTNREPVDKVDEWQFYSSIKINIPIAIGWFYNDDLLIINGDGVFIYHTYEKKIRDEDYEADIKSGFSSDNLKFDVKATNSKIDVFGIRGGGGNLCTEDGKWSFRLLNLAWNIVIPVVTDEKTGSFQFLKLHQIFYQGYKHIGLSKSGNYLAIMADEGIDIYSRMKR